MFLLWICGCNNCTDVFLFYNSHFNAADASFYIVFNFGACPTVSNVSYKTSYARNMSVSILVLMSHTKILLVSYAYSISMYCIPLLLVNGKHIVRYVYNFLVSSYDRPIAENTELVSSSLGGKNMFASPVLDAHYLMSWFF